MSQVHSLRRKNWKVLCFGFVRQWLHLMNIYIQIDDIANIVFDFTFTFDFGFIHNLGNSNVFFNEELEPYTNRNTSDSNHSQSVVIARSPNITCNFNIKTSTDLMTKSRRRHHASSIIFKPFLSTMLGLDHHNNNINNVDKFGKDIRLTIILEKNQCEEMFFASCAGGYRLQCGLIAIPKKILLDSDNYKYNSKTSNTMEHCHHKTYNYRKVFLDRFESFFHTQLKSLDFLVLSRLPEKLVKCATFEKLESKTEVISNNTCTRDGNDDNDDDANAAAINIINHHMSSTASNMVTICVQFRKMSTGVRCTLRQPNVKNFTVNCKAKDVIFDTNNRNHVLLSSDKDISLKTNDFVQLCVDYDNVNKEYIFDIKKGTAQDGKKQDFDKSSSILYNDETPIDEIQCRKLNFEMYDYLFAMSSATCSCDDTQGFAWHVFLEQFDKKVS